MTDVDRWPCFVDGRQGWVRPLGSSRAGLEPGSTAAPLCSTLRLWALAGEAWARVCGRERGWREAVLSAPQVPVCLSVTALGIRELRPVLPPAAPPACNWGLCSRPLQGFKDNLHAVFCLAENSVGPKATRPDDIHLLYSGK